MKSLLKAKEVRKKVIIISLIIVLTVGISIATILNNGINAANGTVQCPDCGNTNSELVIHLFDCTYECRNCTAEDPDGITHMFTLHSYSSGTCTVCGATDPDYSTEGSGGTDSGNTGSGDTTDDCTHSITEGQRYEYSADGYHNVMCQCGYVSVLEQCFDADSDGSCDGCGNAMCDHLYWVSEYIGNGQHAPRCTKVCGALLTEYAEDCTYSNGVCTECGAADPNAGETTTCEHTTTTVEYDAIQHWDKCSECDEVVGSKEYHALETKKDATQHWEECDGCSYTTTRQNHTYNSNGECECGATDPNAGGTTCEHTTTTVQYDSTQHWNECSNCNEVVGSKVNHTLETKTDSTQHWQECNGCSYTTTKQNHTYDSNGNCECGATDPNAGGTTCEHTTTTVQYDSTQHWNECSNCNEVVGSKVNHTLETKSDEAQHWEECNGCSYATTKENHTYDENGDCECGAEDPNAGGTTTCEHTTTTVEYDSTQHWNECSNCNEVVGNKVNHTLETKSDATQHWEECNGCDYTSDKENHTFESKSNETQHWEECTECEHKINEENHSFEEKSNETHHWEECTECEYKTNEENHSYENGKCECGKELQEDECEHTTTKDSNATQHWDKCSKCNEEFNKENHNFTMKSDDTKHWDECTVCKYIRNEESHSYETKSNATQHWEECTECGEEKNVEAHKYVNGECECGTKRAESGNSTGTGNSTNGDGTTTDKDIPNTGNEVATIIVVITGVIALGVAGFVNIKRYKGI